MIGTPHPNLTADDLAKFAQLRIPPGLLAEEEVRSVTDTEARRDFGIKGDVIKDMGGVLFPYFSPVTGRRTTCRVRRAHPEVVDGKTRNKYITPGKDRRHLYILKAAAEKLKQQPDTPRVLIESEKGALAIWAYSQRTGVDLVPIAMGGCWSWHSQRIGIEENARGERVEKKGPLPDLNYCNNSRIYILLDSNKVTNPDVQQAEQALVRELGKKKRGCSVLVCDLPVIDGVNGPDDLVALHGDAALNKVFAEAHPPVPATKAKVIQMPSPKPAAPPIPADEAAKLTGELLEMCRTWIRRFVVLGLPEVIVLAFWLLHSWAFDAAVTTPYIHVCSPEKESGKTTLLRVLKAVARAPRFSSSISASALGRIVAKDQPTLFLDELDAQMKGDRERAQDIRGVLNSGFEIDGTYTRCVGKDFDVVDFPTFCPKVLAGIGELWDTVASRSIRIEMRRRLPSEAVEPFRERRVRKDAAPIAEALQGWTNGNVADLLQPIEVADIPGLGDRQMDMSEPLLQIAQLAGGNWNEELTKALRSVFGVFHQDGSQSATLLSDIRDIFTERNKPHIPSRDLAAALNGIEGRPWAEWSHGKGLSPNNLARLLKKYHIHPTTIWLSDNTAAKGYRKIDFEDAWERYSPSPPISTVRPSEPAPPADETPFSNRKASSSPYGLKIAETRMDTEVLRPNGSKPGGRGEEPLKRQDGTVAQAPATGANGKPKDATGDDRNEQEQPAQESAEDETEWL